MSQTCLKGMLTIEAFIDEQSRAQLTLSQTEMKKLNLQISQELQAIVPHLSESSFAIVGGLYQSSELLQPGFPIHAQLQQYARAALKGENNKRNQLVIGASNGHLPQGLRRNENTPLTPLLLMPFIIITDETLTQEVFEQQLMHKGMGSKDLLIQLQECIDLKIRHVNFMSVLDLAAMMHNHLQMAGFEPLWQLLEQAIFNEAPEVKVITPQFNEFYLSKKIVFSPFFTEHSWKTFGPGLKLANSHEAYLHYTHVQRQYIATLKEHGLDVRQFFASKTNWPVSDQHICFATLDKYRLTQTYYTETIEPIDQQLETTVKKQEHPQLGILYFQLMDSEKGCINYYPLTSSSITEIEEHLYKD